MNPPHHVNGSLSKTGSVILLLVISTSSVFLSVALVPLREPEEVLMKLKATLQRKLCTHMLRVKNKTHALQVIEETGRSFSRRRSSRSYFLSEQQEEEYGTTEQNII